MEYIREEEFIVPEDQQRLAVAYDEHADRSGVPAEVLALVTGRFGDHLTREAGSAPEPSDVLGVTDFVIDEAGASGTDRIVVAAGMLAQRGEG